MKRVTYLRFARVLLPVHASVVDTATAQDDMIKLFDVAESDPEVEALIRADLRSLVAEEIGAKVGAATTRFKPHSGSRQRGEQTGFKSSLRTRRPALCVSLARGTHCDNRECQFSHDRTMWERATAGEQDRLRQMAAKFGQRRQGRQSEPATDPTRRSS